MVTLRNVTNYKYIILDIILIYDKKYWSIRTENTRNTME